jgi:MSHA pilin protein MshC
MVRLLEVSDAYMSIARGHDKKVCERHIGRAAHVARKDFLSPNHCNNVPCELQPSCHWSPRGVAPSHRRQAERGFTLVELIMVIVIMGVLAVYAAPRMFSNADFYARGFHDETLALLRYAQKTAIAQRRMVCVNFNTTTTPHSATLMMEDPTGTGAVSCTVNVAGPRGESPAMVTARTGVTYTSASGLIFNGLGQPVSTARTPLAANATVQVANTSVVITIESGTGYVHE